VLKLSAETYFNGPQTIESVEQEVERLLDEDSLATEVKYGEQPTVVVAVDSRYTLTL
jgi:TATA-binding protein-associated factor Taf7